LSALSAKREQAFGKNKKGGPKSALFGKSRN